MHPPTPEGPWTSNEGPQTGTKSAPKTQTVPTNIPHGSIRVISLEENRGKGGAVTHGMRHARGAYVVFADADGASRFSDLGRLIQGCQKVQDRQGRAVGIGSRAHLVGSEAVVKVKCIDFLYGPQVLTSIALTSSQHSDAFISPSASAPDTSGHFRNQRHPMRIQAIHTRVATLHHSVHAQRGLDF